MERWLVQVQARRGNQNLITGWCTRPFEVGGPLLPCITIFRVCSVPRGRNREGAFRVLCYQNGGESESGLAPPGSSANWRCLALDQLSAVEWREGPWHTASNHSRPASCIVDPDIDADDYPEGDPQ